MSRQKIRGEVARELEELGVSASPEKVREVVEDRLRDEIRRGVQTIQYQVVTLMTTNGQAPFVTVFMYLNEARTPQEKHDLAMIVEETLRQRYEGVKNEAGVWITPAFPKLIYVLEDDNVHEDSPYFYLTQLAAKCTAKRMVPDYISEKKMRELKLSKGETAGNGDCYTLSLIHIWLMACRARASMSIPASRRDAFVRRAAVGGTTMQSFPPTLPRDRRRAHCCSAMAAKNQLTTLNTTTWCIWRMTLS